MRITLAQAAEATGGELRQADSDTEVSGVSTDSRTLQAGELFVALPGEHFDGHDFLAAAFTAGARAAVVGRGRSGLPEGRPLLLVEDTLTAYGKIAGWYRRRFDLSVVAVTGSVGKTTTKNMVGSILDRHGPTLVSPGNQNNEIGVPNVLLSLTEEYRYCVLEFAMRGRGEIAYLAEVAAPSVGIITNIGQTHLGRLGSRDAIAQAKAELLHALPADGVAVLNADDFHYDLFAELAPCPTVSFGLEPRADVRIGDVELRGLAGADFTLSVGSEVVPVEIALPGMHNLVNAAAAAAAAWATTGSTQHIAEGLYSCPTEEMRTKVCVTPVGAALINDAYNAAPRSVVAALDMLAELTGRKIFVFGDMLELGDASEEQHRRIGRLCAQRDIDWLITLGRWAALATAEAAAAGVRSDIVEEPDEAVSLLRAELTSSDIVLVKGSRAMALERVVKGLMNDG